MKRTSSSPGVLDPERGAAPRTNELRTRMTASELDDETVRLVWLVAIVGALTFAGCSSGSSKACTPGASVACACVGGKVGARSCDAAGSEYGVCQCPVVDGGQAGNAGSAGSGGMAGSKVGAAGGGSTGERWQRFRQSDLGCRAGNAGRDVRRELSRAWAGIPPPSPAWRGRRMRIEVGHPGDLGLQHAIGDGPDFDAGGVRRGNLRSVTREGDCGHAGELVGEVRPQRSRVVAALGREQQTSTFPGAGLSSGSGS